MNSPASLPGVSFRERIRVIVTVRQSSECSLMVWRTRKAVRVRMQSVSVSRYWRLRVSVRAG